MIDANTEVVIDSKDIEVIIDKNVSLIDNNIDVEILEPEYEITVNRKEYTVVGDELYIPKRYEDAPQWLRDIIDNVTDVALSAKISEINDLTQSLNNLIVELEVAKNTYTQSIISSNDIDERINTAIETLNSSVMESDATILGLATTRVTPEQAQAISIDAIRTSLNDTISGNSLGSIISEINAATTTGDYTNAQSIEVLQSTIEGNADATATAIDTINTFAGIDEAGAYTYTGLTGYLVDPNTGMIGGGQSELQNTITTTGDNVEAKFEYGSNIKIGGKYHNAGFGLKTTMTGGDGTINDPYNSEFWINAEKFKFTNNAISGQVSPFSIDATGLQPKITFNGLVSFNNLTGYTPPDISGTINNNNNVLAQKLGYLNYADMVAAATRGQTIINGGYLRGELIEANSINAGQLNAYAITGKNITGGTIRGTQIIGSVIKGSFIDLTTTLALTNWQYYTPATIPVGYAANFAHHNDGSLVVDSQGYVRLAGQQNFIIPPIVQSGTISGDETRQINKTYDLYSWDSYNVDTLQRGIRQDTSFTSTAELVFSAEGGPAVNSRSYEAYFYLTFLHKSIIIHVGSFGSNAHTSAHTDITFDGTLVASAVGSLGADLTTPWDSGWVDYSTTIKGIPISIKTTITSGASITMEFKAVMSSLNPIIGHSIDDIIRIDKVIQGGNTQYKTLNYNVNFPSIWVQ